MYLSTYTAINLALLLPNHSANKHQFFQILNKALVTFHLKMLNPRILIHQSMAKLTMSNQDQPTAEKRLLKSMNFFHAFDQVSKWVLNRFSLPIRIAKNMARLALSRAS